MVPIHDTDVAEQRWSQGEWEHYELWEKIEIRLRRRKRLWIAGSVVLFFMLSSVPVLVERSPYWSALKASRHLAQELGHLKREASTDHVAYRIRFEGGGSLRYVVEKADQCQSNAFVPVRQGNLLEGWNTRDPLLLLSVEQGKSLGFAGLTEHFCYDALKGGEVQVTEQAMGFGILPVKDLTQRQDRISLVLVSGTSAEISFE